jgi:hypothetical protein
MSEVECECPFCPFEAIQVDICDARVKFDPKNNNIVYTANLQQYDKLKKHFITIALYCRNNLELKKGCSWQMVKKNTKFTVENIGKEEFKLCIHTVSQQNEENPE